MVKTLRQYEELFEDLMNFTDFKSTDEIQTQGDLNEFFNQIKSHSKKKNRVFKVSKVMFNTFADVLEKVRKPIISPRVRAIESKKLFNTLAEAKLADLLVVINAEKSIFKTSVKVKGKDKIRWRDNKGRFSKPPSK